MGLVGAAGQKLDYEKFYSLWAAKQQATILDLQDALHADLIEPELQHVVERATTLYESYYDAINDTLKHDVLQVVSPSWKTPLEKAFMWLGEWRPSVGFQLVYALAGQKVEEELAELLDGIETSSFGSLSASQIALISRMQMRTLEEEDQLRYHVAAMQQSIADRPMLSLAQVVDIGLAGRGCDFKEGKGEVQPYRTCPPCNKSYDAECISRTGRDDDGHTMQFNEGEHYDELRGADGLLKVAMCEKLKRLEELSLAADSLRRRTLTGLLELLNTVQRAQFLLACFQLQVAIRHVGERLRHTSVQV